MKSDEEASPATLSIETQSRQMATARTKKPYERPRVTVYGTVKQLTNATSGSGADFLGRRMMISDRASKERIVKVGTHPMGFGLYLFNYKPEFCEALGYGRQFGVIADEVESIAPAAVSLGPGGYKLVDYAKLGIFTRNIVWPVANPGADGFPGAQEIEISIGLSEEARRVQKDVRDA